MAGRMIRERIPGASGRRRLAAGFAGVAALFFLAACPQPNGEPVADEPADPPGAEAPAVERIALGASCVNETIGFRVAYPDDWLANEGNGLPACSAFDPGTGARGTDPAGGRGGGGRQYL